MDYGLAGKRPRRFEIEKTPGQEFAELIVPVSEELGCCIRGAQLEANDIVYSQGFHDGESTLLNNGER